MTEQYERQRFEHWCQSYSSLDLTIAPGAKHYANVDTEAAWCQWRSAAMGTINRVAELEAKLDICKRYAEGEWYDPSYLAADYGGTGWELDPACLAVEAASRLSANVPDGWVLTPRDATDEMVEAAEDVEDLYRRGTPNTWKRVYTQMIAHRPPNPTNHKQDQLSKLKADALNLIFALHDAWPYVHQWCTIEHVKDRIGSLIQKHGDFADQFEQHTRKHYDVVVTTTQSGQCVAVTRQDEEGRVKDIIWTAPTSAHDRIVLYGFDDVIVGGLEQKHMIKRYGVFEPNEQIWWCKVATQPSTDLYEPPHPLRSRQAAEMAACIVGISANGEKCVLKNRYTHQPILPPVLPTYVFTWER